MSFRASFRLPFSFTTNPSFRYLLRTPPPPPFPTHPHTGNYRQGANRYIYRDRLLRMHRRHHSASDADSSPPDVSGGVEATGASAASSSNSADWDPNQCYVYVDLAHVGEYDAALLGQLLRRPAEALPVMEAAAADALRTLLYVAHRAGAGGSAGGAADDDDDDGAGVGADGEADASVTGGGGGGDDANNPTPRQLFGGNSVQVLLRGNLTPTPLRSIQSHHMNSLLKCPGIITSCARVRPRAMALRVRCAKCMDSRTVFGNSSVSGGRNSGGGGGGAAAAAGGGGSPFSGFSLPMRCLGPNPQECGPAPYSVLPDECLFVDQQTLKLQEAPEMVPTGEMPRSGECVLRRRRRRRRRRRWRAPSFAERARKRRRRVLMWKELRWSLRAANGNLVDAIVPHPSRKN